MNDSGKSRRRVCRRCRQEYKDEWYRQNRERAIAKTNELRTARKVKFYAWLREQECTDCGLSDIRVLEFDHLKDKKFNIATKIGSLSFEKLMEEVAKCEIVCSNCHRIRTAKRAGQYAYLPEEWLCQRRSPDRETR